MQTPKIQPLIDEKMEGMSKHRNIEILLKNCIIFLELMFEVRRIWI